MAAARGWCCEQNRSSRPSRRRRELARPIIALTPSGRVFTHEFAAELASLDGFTLLCGRYEGFDQRALDLVVDDELSLGDFVLAGGELAALCVIESVARSCRRTRQRRLERRGVLQRGPARIPAVHQARRGSWGGCPRDLALRRSRTHRTMAPGPSAAPDDLLHRPDLIKRRGGLSALDEAILAEFPEMDDSQGNG